MKFARNAFGYAKNALSPVNVTPLRHIHLPSEAHKTASQLIRESERLEKLEANLGEEEGMFNPPIRETIQNAQTECLNQLQEILAGKGVGDFAPAVIKSTNKPELFPLPIIHTGLTQRNPQVGSGWRDIVLRQNEQDCYLRKSTLDYLSAMAKESPRTDERLLKKLITPSEIRTIDDTSASERNEDSIKRGDIEYVRLTSDRVKGLNLAMRQRLEEVRKESFDQAKKSCESTGWVL